MATGLYHPPAGVNSPPVRPRPLITLTTDFGTADHYVAAMKAVLLTACPAATLVDVTHHVPRQDVTAGAFTLERAVAAFPPGTVHLAVVDPGVGTARRLLVADVAGSTVVCPDNGMATWAWRRHPGGTARELTWRPAASSHTFHGRDVMAPGRRPPGRRRAVRIPRPLDPVLLDLHLAPDRPGRRHHPRRRLRQRDHERAGRVVGRRRPLARQRPGRRAPPADVRRRAGRLAADAGRQQRAAGDRRA